MPIRLRVISSTARASGASAAPTALRRRCASRPRRASAAGVRARRRGASARSPPGRSRARRAPRPRARRPAPAIAVVLAVGARFSGQASRSTAASRCTSARRASADSGFPVIAISRAPATLDQRHDREQFGGGAGVRQREQHVVAGDHPEVAVTRLGRVDEERRRSGRSQRRGDLSRDVSRLAHPAHDYPALCTRGRSRRR